MQFASLCRALRERSHARCLPSTPTRPSLWTAYFSQFGRVTKVRLSRSKKTGRSKHYAFIEFYSAEVARIAAEAMDGYMFFGQKLQVCVGIEASLCLAPEQVLSPHGSLVGCRGKVSFMLKPNDAAPLSLCPRAQAKLLLPSQVHKDLMKGSNRVFKKVGCWAGREGGDREIAAPARHPAVSRWPPRAPDPAHDRNPMLAGALEEDRDGAAQCRAGRGRPGHAPEAGAEEGQAAAAEDQGGGPGSCFGDRAGGGYAAGRSIVQGAIEGLSARPPGAPFFWIGAGVSASSCRGRAAVKQHFTLPLCRPASTTSTRGWRAGCRAPP